MSKTEPERHYCVMDYRGSILYQGQRYGRAAELWTGDTVVGQAETRHDAWQHALKLSNQARAAKTGNVKMRKMAGK